VANREDGGRWIVDALGAPHVSEKEVDRSFVDKIAALSPQLVTSLPGLGKILFSGRPAR
jgi:hypothetical protein